MARPGPGTQTLATLQGKNFKRTPNIFLKFGDIKAGDVGRLLDLGPLLEKCYFGALGPWGVFERWDLFATRFTRIAPAFYFDQLVLADLFCSMFKQHYILYIVVYCVYHFAAAWQPKVCKALEGELGVTRCQYSTLWNQWPATVGFGGIIDDPLVN